MALPILLFSFFIYFLSRMRIKQETRVHPSHRADASKCVRLQKF